MNLISSVTSPFANLVHNVLDVMNMHVVTSADSDSGASYRGTILDDVLPFRDICQGKLMTKVNIICKYHGSRAILQSIPGMEIHDGSCHVVFGVNDNELSSF
jgi:hypothetical protein